MFAIAFDLVCAEAQQHHPKKNAQAAYGEIRKLLEGMGFSWRQGSLYTTDDDDLTRLFSAIVALKALPWFPKSVRDIRAFKVESWSDFTALVKA